VAALLGGSAPFVSAGGSAAIAAAAAGSDVVIIAAAFNVSAFHLMARPEIKQPSDLKGKKAGISAFGSSSDILVRLALKKYGLEPGKDVAILPMGGQPEAFAALQNGSIHLAGLTFPLYLSAAKAGMSEPIKVSEVGFEDVTGTVITTRSFISQQRDTALRFLRAFIRGMHRYKTDKEFSKKVFAKYGKITDDYLLEGTWQESAGILQKVPRPSPKGLQYLIEAQFKDKSPLPKPETFVDNSLLEQLEKSGFIDSLYRP
jgi:NitT/TauT family transport system substrate-binding protein